MSDPHPYSRLTPDVVLNALDAVGLRCDGRLLALNSYENRVYQVGQEESRAGGREVLPPGALERRADPRGARASPRSSPSARCRWSPPLAFATARTLHEPRASASRSSRAAAGARPELERRDTLEWLGRFIGRIHAVGRARPFVHRPALDIESFGDEPRDWLLAERLHPARPARGLEAGRADLALEGVRHCFERAGEVRHAPPARRLPRRQRAVDRRRARTSSTSTTRACGPAVQDLWMLVSGDRETMARAARPHPARATRTSREFDDRELHLLEALRTLRLLHYSAWLARRWDDPAFPIAFPFFDTPRYWQDRVLELREQIAAMQEPPLVPRSVTFRRNLRGNRGGQCAQ